MSTMIQIGEVRRYTAGERVPWWCIFKRPTFKGWPRWGQTVFGCDVDVSLDQDLQIHVQSCGPGRYMIDDNSHYMLLAPPGKNTGLILQGDHLTAIAFIN